MNQIVLSNTFYSNLKMLRNLQPTILFHRHSDINGTDKDEISNCLKMHILHLGNKTNIVFTSLTSFLTSLCPFEFVNIRFYSK